MTGQPINYYSNVGVNTYTNPLFPENDGVLLHSVNMDTFPYGAKTKRAGYGTVIGTLPAGVQTLWSFTKNDGTSQWVYAKAGSVIYSSYQGTGAWTVTGNGTVDASAQMGNTVLNNTQIIGDGVGSTRHTTSGTSWTNTSLAPIGRHFEQFQNRVYLMGTASTLFYSSANDATNWSTSGTSDSSSFTVPGAGIGASIFKSTNQLVATKSSGLMYRWDGFSLRDMATTFGPTSPYSIGEVEGYYFYMNQYGHYGFNGDRSQLLSNAVQRQFYNEANTGIAGTQIGTVPAVCHRYNYLASIGTVTDNFTNITIPNAILRYDYQKNEYSNYQFNDFPRAWHSYRTVSNEDRLLFADNTGLVFEQGGSYTTDNGNPIPTSMIYLFHFGAPQYDKQWRWIRLFFNPGCQAQVQIACTNDFQDFDSKKWVDVGDVSAGMIEFKPPPGSFSKFMLLRIYESGRAARYSYYGASITAEIRPQQ